MGLKGKVRSYTEIGYKLAEKNGVSEKQYKFQTSIYSFNEQGFKIELKQFEDYEQELEIWKTFKYDSSGN